MYLPYKEMNRLFYDFILVKSQTKITKQTEIVPTQ